MGVTLTWRQPPEREPRSHREEVEIGRGRARVRGHLAYSDRSGPGVLVLHEFFGLQPSFVAFCDYLAEEGFTAFVPDLYDGRIAASVEEASTIASGLDLERVRLRLVSAAEHLRDNWHPRLGAVGFSLGASLGSELARAFPLDALVLYYGLGPLDSVDSGLPVLGHFAEHDDWESLDDVRPLFALSQERELHVHPGVGHWFANPSVSEAFVEAAARRAHERTVDFLGHHLS